MSIIFFNAFNLNTGLNLGWIIPKHLGDIETDQSNPISSPVYTEEPTIFLEATFNVLKPLSAWNKIDSYLLFHFY